MKKTGLITALILFASIYTNTQVFAQVLEIKPLFSLQNIPNPFEEITDINFILQEDGLVKLYVVNIQTGELSMLVDSEMSSGKHGIIFKANRQLYATKYHCKMMIFSIDGNTLVYSTEIEMKQK